MSVYDDVRARAGRTTQHRRDDKWVMVYVFGINPTYEKRINLRTIHNLTAEAEQRET